MTGDQGPFDLVKKLNERLDIDFALQAAGLGVWELDPFTRQVIWNERCCELFGIVTDNQLLLQQAIQYIHPQDKDRIDQAIETALDPRSDGLCDQTFRILGAGESQLRWVRLQGRSYFNEAGERYRFAGIAQEVTQQVRAQQGESAARCEGQRQQRIYEAITASTPDLIYVFDLRYRFTYANQALLDMWGSSWDESIGKGLLENGYEPWHAQMHEREIDRVVATRQPIRGEVSFPHATLGKRIYDYVFAPVFNDMGEVEAVAGTTRDITDSKQIQELIWGEEGRFRALIEEAPVATMLMVGPEHTIDVANEAMIRMLGKDSSIVGQPATVAVPELASQAYLQLLNQVFVSGTAHEAKAMPGELVVNGTTELHYFDFTYKPLRNRAGQVYGIISMAMDVTEQVQALQLKEESQRQLLTLFEQSPIGLATISADDELVFQWVNAFYGELVARPPQAIVGKPLLDALPELKGQGFDEILKNVIATGTPFIALEVAVGILRNGQLTTIYVDLTYQPRKGAQGDVQGILVVATDVTQQVNSRQQIEASEAKLRSIITTAPAGMGLFVGRDLIVELPNQTFIDIVGKGPDIVGKPLREVMPELLTEDQPFLHILDDVYTSGQMFQSPGSRVSIVQQGMMTHNYYNITYTPLRDEKGEVYAILDIAIDVTEQIQAQQALKESQDRLQSVIDLAELGSYTIDLNTNRLIKSPRVAQWYGLPEVTEVDTSFDAILERDRSRVRQVLADALAPGSAGFYEVEYTVIHAQTGHQRILRTNGQVIRNEDGQPVRVGGTVMDITNQRALQLALEQQVEQRTEELAATNEEMAATNEELAANNEEYAAINEELEEANFLLSRSNDNLQQFAYVASHDLQEPLRKIQQFSDLLRTRYAEASGQELVYLERMQSAARRMSVLIKDLLNYSRITSQRDTSSRVALSQVVDDVLIDLELLRAETEALIEVDPLPVVEGDAGQLGQLFQNLLSNAIKFRRPAVAPHIQIKLDRLLADQLPTGVKPARTAPAYYQIKVIDNGIGFDDKYVDRIFQVFQRLHGKSEYAGTGIGLAICEKVVVNHGGAIGAQSQPGQGATFLVYLPVLG